MKKSKDDDFIILNGGHPLAGCPENWEEANGWADEANSKKCIHNEPSWSFDCGFKLDFDGPILSVSSRFYPPKEYYGDGWDGMVTIGLLGKPIVEKKFECDTLEELRCDVEKYVKSFHSDILKQVVAKT